MSFGPDEIAIGFFVDNADQFFELLLGLLEARVVGSLRCGLRAP